MASSENYVHLWIASDAKTTAVALTEVGVSGRSRVHEWGSVTDTTPEAPMTREAASRRAAQQIMLVAVVFGGLCMAGGGAYAGLLISGGLVLSLVAIVGSVRAEQPGRVRTPSMRSFPDIHRVLSTPQEQRTFRALVKLAERVGRTLPELDELVEPNEAGELLAQALWDGAKTLARKQDVRAVRDDLRRHETHASDESSRAHRDLMHQRQQADALWEEVNGDLAKLVAQLTAAAESGERFIRDQDLDVTLQRTEKALAELSTDLMAGPSGASEQLADETTAVLDAYNELNDLYGGKH
ncbi:MULTISPECIES: hypothetical protein [unclassified Micromonospora]|uniref:hypothetical protein n=1 Tax=unclassified Micromonospora TaxID=2617518 RepID=UPI002FF2E4B6